MDPPQLLNLIVLAALAGNLGFYQDVPYDLGKKVPEVDFANVRYCWMICIHENTLSQVYLPTSALNPNIHITSHYKVWWLAKHDDYLHEGVQHLIDRLTPSHIKSKPPKKLRLILVVEVKIYALMKLRNDLWRKLREGRNDWWIIHLLLHTLNFLLNVVLTMWVRIAAY